MYKQIIVAAILMVSVAFTPTLVFGESVSEPGWPVGDVRRCQDQARLNNYKVERFEVLPGLGWDNLRNLEAAVVVTYNFSLCKVTDDGNFLIPDNMYVIPIKESRLELFADIVEHSSTTSSMTSKSINVNAGITTLGFNISGKYSSEHEQLKTKQINDKTMTTRVQMRYHRYEAKLQPDPELDPHFKSRLLSIAASIEYNRTEQARYEGQLLVRDFGTHVLTSVTAGAALVKDDYLDENFLIQKSEEKKSILHAGSMSFSKVFNISMIQQSTFALSGSNQKTEESTLEESYDQNTRHSFVKILGGPMYKGLNGSIDDWVNGLDKNLVPMDRRGDPIYFLVTPQTLPEIPAIIVSEVEQVVRESVELYYGMNLISGCTKPDSPKFSFSANYDDGSCTEEHIPVFFGGVFQTCTVVGQYLNNDPCYGLSHFNTKTGGYSCPSNYQAIELRSEFYGEQTENKRECHKQRHLSWLVDDVCETHQYYSRANYKTYWCAATDSVPSESGFMFGGLYTPRTVNPITGKPGCPDHFYSFPMFTDLYICLGDDLELGKEFAVPFGGFFSCNTGNPLAVPTRGAKGSDPMPNTLHYYYSVNAGPEKWPSKCPEGYSQHMATTVNGCDIHYCLESGALKGNTLPPIKRPPFIKKPPVLLEDEDSIVGFDGFDQTWGQDQQTSSSKNNDNSKMSPEAAAGISAGATLGCVALATMVIVIIQKRRSRKNGSHRRLSEETWPTVRYGSNHGSVETHNAGTASPTQPHSSV